MSSGLVLRELHGRCFKEDIDSTVYNPFCSETDPGTTGFLPLSVMGDMPHSLSLDKHCAKRNHWTDCMFFKDTAVPTSCPLILCISGPSLVPVFQLPCLHSFRASIFTFSAILFGCVHWQFRQLLLPVTTWHWMTDIFLSLEVGKDTGSQFIYLLLIHRACWLEESSNCRPKLNHLSLCIMPNLC